MPNIKISTDKKSYDDGEILYATGQVDSILEGVIITLEIFAPNDNLVYVTQSQLKTNGTFSCNIPVGGDLWNTIGNYSLVAVYGSESDEPISDSVTFDFISEIEIPESYPSLERVPIANLRIVDTFGNSLDRIPVHQQVSITFDIANGQDNEQSFALVIQVQEPSGPPTNIFKMSAMLSPGQSYSPSFSWNPPRMGEYTISVMIWDDFISLVPLSPELITSIEVSPE